MSEYETRRRNLVTLSERKGRAAPTAIRVREPFIRTDGGDKPPAALLVHSKGNSLRTALIVVFLAQTQPGAAPHRLQTPASVRKSADIGICDLLCTPPRNRKSGGSNGLAGSTDGAIYSRSTTRREQDTTRKSLRALARPDISLLQPMSRGAGGRRLSLLQDVGPRAAGTPLAYSLPSEDEKCVDIPIEFFTHGWVLVLSNAELVVYLMYLFALSHGDTFVSGDVRRGQYGINDTAWDQYQGLCRAGLLDYEVDPRRRSDGTVVGQSADAPLIAHRFTLVLDGLNKDALEAVTAAVETQTHGGSGGDGRSPARGLNARAVASAKAATAHQASGVR